MAKSSKKVARQYTNDEAIKLHAEAHKSDPFAAKHIAKTLHKYPREASSVGAEASMLVNTRKHDKNAFGAFFNTWEGHELRLAIAAKHPVKQPRKRRVQAGVRTGRLAA